MPPHGQATPLGKHARARDVAAWCVIAKATWGVVARPSGAAEPICRKARISRRSSSSARNISRNCGNASAPPPPCRPDASCAFTCAQEPVQEGCSVYVASLCRHL